MCRGRRRNPGRKKKQRLKRIERLTGLLRETMLCWGHVQENLTREGVTKKLPLTPRGRIKKPSPSAKERVIDVGKKVISLRKTSQKIEKRVTPRKESV